MQNEHRVDNAEKLTDEKDDLQHPENSETSRNNETPTNPSEDSPKENADIVNNEEILSSANDEQITSLPSEIIPSESSLEKDQIDDEEHDNENTDNKESNESKDINENNENEENNKNIEMPATVVQDVEESHTEIEISRIKEEEEQRMTTNPTPPPKPPRLKSGNMEDTNNEKESSKENDEDEKEKNDKEKKTSNEQNLSARTVEKSISAISKRSVEAIENSIEKVEEDEYAEEPEKVEVDGTQDDADVVQSPAPRTGKTRISSYKKLNKNQFIFFKISYYFKIFEFVNKNCQSIIVF